MYFIFLFIFIIYTILGGGGGGGSNSTLDIKGKYTPIIREMDGQTEYLGTTQPLICHMKHNLENWLNLTHSVTRDTTMHAARAFWCI